jgi:hypothetical protein
MYVNVRRQFILVEKSIDEGAQWVVFEPNDEPSWAGRHIVTAPTHGEAAGLDVSANTKEPPRNLL